MLKLTRRFYNTMSNIDLHLIRGEKDIKSRKTKVICTLGPACWSVDGLVDLIDGGMNVARYVSMYLIIRNIHS